MSHSWLQRQRKQALLDLATEAGLPQDEELRKDELVEELDAHLQRNATSLSRVPAFEEYYGKRRATPGRPPRESTALQPAISSGEETVKSIVKKVKRATKSTQEEAVASASPIVASVTATARNALASVSSALSPSQQLTSRTPAPRRRRSELPGPPSPADVADIVEHESTRVASNIRALYGRSGITENISSLRELCSSVTSVQLTFLFIEAIALQKHLIPWNFAFDIPSTPISLSIAVFVPDLFILLTGFYWSTTLLWSATSIFVPLLFAYFYNLTLREVKRGNTHVTVARYTADPLMFNIVKALATYLVYYRGETFGFINLAVSHRVALSIFYGPISMLIASGIGALAALYEATQKRHA